MNCYGARELAESFRTVRKNTIRLAEDIPEEQYGFIAAAGARSVEKMLTHIALAHEFYRQFHEVEKRTDFAGFDFQSIAARAQAAEAKQRTKSEVIALLEETGEAWADFVAGLSEEFLAQQIAMPPGASPASRSRFEMLLAVKEHEMHHRAMLMLIERMLGIVPHLTVERQKNLDRMRNQARDAER